MFNYTNYFLIYTVRLEKRKQKAIARVYQEYEDYVDTFAFIAGYTKGGSPFGITYGEMEEHEMGEVEGRTPKY